MNYTENITAIISKNNSAKNTASVSQLLQSFKKKYR